MAVRFQPYDATKERPVWGEFLCAGTSAVLAIGCTNPVDVVKTRMVLQGAGPGPKKYTGVASALWQIGRAEGPRGLQRGLCPACFWQFSNVGTRFGVYHEAKKHFGIGAGDCSPLVRWMQNMCVAAVSGGLGAIVSCPFFIVKTRYQASPDVSLPGLWTQLGDMHRADGPAGWMRGLSAFAPRVIVASSVQLSTYDLVKGEMVQKLGLRADATGTHAAASMATGLAVVAAMQPFDFACTRLANSRTAAEKGGAPSYAGPMDVIRKTIANEGVLGIYSGVTANYLRFGPYCILTFVFVEKLRALEKVMLGF